MALREVLVRYEIRPDRAAPEEQKAHHVTLIPSRGARLVVRRRR